MGSEAVGRQIFIDDHGRTIRRGTYAKGTSGISTGKWEPGGSTGRGASGGRAGGLVVDKK
jgi:hypothetical protein